MLQSGYCDIHSKSTAMVEGGILVCICKEYLLSCARTMTLMATFHFGQLQGRISKAFQAEVIIQVFKLHIDCKNTRLTHNV
jgi:hypothetical protein